MDDDLYVFSSDIDLAVLSAVLESDVLREDDDLFFSVFVDDISSMYSLDEINVLQEA